MTGSTDDLGDGLCIRAGTIFSEGSANYDLLFDVNGDRTLNSGDQALTSAEVGRQCHNTGANTGNERNWYNGDGLRVRARTFPNGAGAVNDDPTWDVGAGLPVTLAGRRTQSGVTTATKFVYGLGLISTTDNAGAASYYLADGLGSTTQLVDSAGALTGDAYTYDAFGAPRTATGATPNDFRFTGQQTDAKANRGLYYLRARHYDPSLGRFLGRDPVPFAQRYAYVGNNPGNATDPFGLSPAEGSFGSYGRAYVDYCPGAEGLFACTRPGLPGSGQLSRHRSCGALCTILGRGAEIVLNVLNPVGDCQKLVLGTLAVGAATGAALFGFGLAFVATLEVPPLAVLIALEGGVLLVAGAGATAGVGYSAYEVCTGH